jgi:periplasmic protein CpxP/Spy
MIKIYSNQLAPAALAALLSLSAAALAQSSQVATPTPQGAAPPAAASSPMAGHPVAGKNAAERVEHRITELHAQLRITPAERQQWDQFVEVMRENARDMDQAFIQRAQQFPSMTALQNMQSYEQLAEAHARHLQKLVPAFENLYNAMPDQQKRLADQVFRANAEQHQQSAIQSHRGRNG